MDFFAHEDRARRATRRLVVLFALAVVALVGGLDVAAWWVIESQPHLQPYRADVLLWLTVAALFMIGAGSVYKTASLSGGGSAVALMLGARPLSPSPTSPAERMYANVVEEMAIASGTPLPRAYVLEESGMNAFAAGHSANDAAVVVTRGCLDALSRDELQGVIAHEFSHLLNGDMRLNLRLIGLLHGILLIGLSGRLLMRLGGGGRSSKGNGQIVMAGAALAAIGYGGWFFGQLIKAAVSREREFLADASAVQFTRNPTGIGGALKKIGVGSYRSFIVHEQAEQFSHLYFACGVRSSALSLFATHPPLETRIRAIDPTWDGAWPALPSAPAPTAEPTPRPSPPAGARMPLAADGVAGRIGRIAPEHVAFGAALLASLPPTLAESARIPFSARAAALALLLHAAEGNAAAQLDEVRRLDAPLAVEVERLRGLVAPLGAAARLPLLNLCIPTLRELTPAQRESFLACLRAATGDDPPLAEYALSRLLRVHLSPIPPQPGTVMALTPLLPALSPLLGALARAGTSDTDAARQAFASAVARLLDSGGTLPFPAASPTADELDRALGQIAGASPGVKRRILTAFAWCVSCDGSVTVAEAELLRTISDCIGCPLPPFLDRAPAAV